MGWVECYILSAVLQFRVIDFAARADNKGHCTVTLHAGVIIVNEIPRLGVLGNERKRTRRDAGESPGRLIPREPRDTWDFALLKICSWLGRGVGLIS